MNFFLLIVGVHQGANFVELLNISIGGKMKNTILLSVYITLPGQQVILVKIPSIEVIL